MQWMNINQLTDGKFNRMKCIKILIQAINHIQSEVINIHASLYTINN